MNDAVAMTQEDLVAIVQAIAAANGMDLDDIRRCTVNDLVLMARGYQQAAAPHELTRLERFEAWLNEAAKLVTPLGTLAGAMGAMLGVATAAKAL